MYFFLVLIKKSKNSHITLFVSANISIIFRTAKRLSLKYILYHTPFKPAHPSQYLFLGILAQLIRIIKPLFNYSV